MLVFYGKELSHLDQRKFAAAIKSCMANKKWPSVAELQQMCNAVIDYEAPLKDTEPTKSKAHESLPTADVAKHFETQAEYAYKLKAPFPKCCDRNESVAFWNEKLAEMKRVGWFVFSWREHQCMSEIETDLGKGTVKQKQQVYFAFAYVSRHRHPTQDAHSELTDNSKPLATEWKAE